MGAKVLIVDDDELYARALAARIEGSHASVRCDVISAPFQAIKALPGGWDLFIVDLEMPELDGRKLRDLAVKMGVPPKRIVINSSHDADHLHETFNMGECLAVISKIDPNQQAVLEMILDNLERRVQD